MNGLHEIYIHRSDYPELVELYEAWFNHELKMDYYHFVYLNDKDGLQLIICRGSSDPIAKLNVEFLTRFRQLKIYSFDELCFLISVYQLDCMLGEIEVVPKNLALLRKNLPLCVYQLLESTYGYLINWEQGASLYRLATGCDLNEANDWVKRLRLKDDNILQGINFLKIENKPIDYLYDLILHKEGLHCLVKKPVNEAQVLLKYCSY
ncbi:MAG: hypothetical protein WCK18_06005 [Prolixibacteraceae bacterium]